MLFNSYIFAVFALAVYALYRQLEHRWQNRMLLVASYIFYGAWDWRFLGLIVFSTVIDFVTGQWIHRSDDPQKRRFYLIISVCSNLGILAVFKYFNFFAENLDQILSLVGLQAGARLPHILLPVGISFYTFQTMSYTIDIYRGQLKPTNNFFDFALFVAYFPQLVAGPIERAQVLLPRLSAPRSATSEQIQEAIWLLLSGYYLKVVLADNMAPLVQWLFQNPQHAEGLEILAGIYAAAFQIYGDFGGYSRIARGVSLLLGIELMQNFNRPYLAVSPSDFWRRWHISLSTWLRDYLYISLGGNRHRTYRNLMATMLLGGLWHGASWNFVAWGFFHGAILCIYRVFKPLDHATNGSLKSIAWRVVNTLFFFHLTCFGWLLFFVRELNDVQLLITHLFDAWKINGRGAIIDILFLAGPVMIAEIAAEIRGRQYVVFSLPQPARIFVYATLVFLIGMFGVVGDTEFIYFQF